MQDWIREHSDLLALLTAGSAVMVVMMLIVVPVCIIRIPHDYFVCEREACPLVGMRAWAAMFLKALKNLLAVVFILLGIVMIPLPGPGFITLGMGLLLLDYPGKRRLRAWLMSRKHIAGTMDWVRRKAKCAPLQRPAEWNSDQDRKAA